MLRTTAPFIVVKAFARACLVCVWLGFVSMALAQGINISYDQEKQLLSLSCNNVSLNQLASSLQQQTGIQVIVYPDAEKHISANFKNLPLDRAFERIGDGSGRIFYFSKSQNQKRLVAVHFLDASNAGGASSSVSYDPPPADVEYMQENFEQESVSRDFEDQPELMPELLPPPELIPEYQEQIPPAEN